MKPIKLPDGILDVDVYPLHFESWFRESETECYINVPIYIYVNGGIRQCTPELIELIEANRPKPPEPLTNEELMKEYNSGIKNSKVTIDELEVIKELLSKLNSHTSKRVLSKIEDDIDDMEENLEYYSQRKKALIEWINENNNKQLPMVSQPK